MTRSEVMSVLQAKGMGPEAEKELKQLMQLHIAAAKATTPRKQRQNEHRIKAVWPSVDGLGLYWFQEYVRESH